MGGVAVLASCETVADVREAWGRGYAAAVVVPEFAGKTAYQLGDGPDAVTVLPCPAQTSERTCTDCRLCFDDRRLLARRLAIGFEVHGGGANKAKAALKRRSLPMA